LQPPPKLDNGPAIDKTATGIGLIVATLIGFGISFIPQDHPLRQPLVTIAPTVGIAITAWITAINARAAARWQEIDRETRINEAIYVFLQRRRDSSLSDSQRERTLAALEELEQMRDELVMERARQGRSQR
jgi:hypothetical protein